MPTLDLIGPYRIYFYSHEPNEPPHVHIDRDDATMKVWLGNLTVASSRGFRPKEIRKIVAMVESDAAAYLERWNDYFQQGR